MRASKLDPLKDEIYRLLKDEGHLDASVSAMNTNVREGDGMVTFTYRVVPELLLQPEHVRPAQ